MAFQFVFPPMKEVGLTNGLHSLWLSDHEQPVIEILLQIPAGRLHDPEGMEGLAELTANLMLKGPTNCTHEQYIDAMEQVGASNVLDLGEEQMIFGVRTLTKFAESIVPRFWDIISSPAFDKSEFARVKREMLTALQAEHADPGSLAGKHFQAELYGHANPLGRSATTQSVQRVGIDDVRSFYERHIGAVGGTIVAAGDEDAAVMSERWRPLFERWRGAAAPQPPLFAEVPKVASTRIRLVDKPDSSQTTLVIGHPSVSETHQQRDALALGNYILGGGNFSSRLMAQVRSTTGKTYGISSQVISNRANGTFLITTTTQNSQLKDVIKAILDVYDELTSKGVTEHELAKAKQFATGNLAFQLEGIGNIAEKLVWLRFYGFDKGYIENYASIIDAIDLQAVNSALKQTLRSDAFVISAVGKRSEIQSQLESFGRVHVVNFRANT